MYKFKLGEIVAIHGVYRYEGKDITGLGSVIRLRRDGTYGVATRQGRATHICSSFDSDANPDGPYITPLVIND